MTAGIGLNGLNQGWQLFASLLIFILVLVVTYLVTRWVAGYQKGQLSRGNIRVIETFRLSQTKYIQIIKVGSRYMVIGVCKDAITMITPIEEAELDLSKYNDGSETFQAVFQRVKEWNQKKEK